MSYESQLRERRRATHARVAQALKKIEAGRLDELAALIALHWESAEIPAEAVAWHERAGIWTMMNDPSSSFRHWQRVRELVDGLPPDPETLSRGALACSQMLNIGWRLGRSEADGTRAFEDGKAFAERAGDTAQLALLNGGYSAVRGLTLGLAEDYVSFGRQAVHLADQTQDEALRCAMRVWLTHGYLFTGRFADAHTLADEALGRLPSDPAFGSKLIGLNLRSVLLAGRTCSTAWMGGRVDEVKQSFLDVIDYSTRHQSREPEVYARSTFALWSLLVGEEATALTQSRAAMRVSEALNSSDLLWATWSLMATGRALLANGDHEEALRTLETLVKTVEAVSMTHVNWGLAIASLSEALRVSDRVGEARERAEESLAFSRERSLAWDLLPWFACARACIAQDDRAAALEVIEDLSQRIEVSGQVYRPHLHECRAAFAERFGEQFNRATELRHAQRLYRQMGAGRHAERLSGNP